MPLFATNSQTLVPLLSNNFLTIKLMAKFWLSTTMKLRRLEKSKWKNSRINPISSNTDNNKPVDSNGTILPVNHIWPKLSLNSSSLCNKMVDNKITEVKVEWEDHNKTEDIKTIMVNKDTTTNKTTCHKHRWCQDKDNHKCQVDNNNNQCNQWLHKEACHSNHNQVWCKWHHKTMVKSSNKMQLDFFHPSWKETLT